MIAAVIGMIPEGLYLLASVALAVSSIRLAQKKVLLHDMRCIETLARVDVLCVDKTGTITENTMKVQGVIPTEEYDPEEMEPLDVLVSDFAASMTKDNITMAAIKEHFTKGSGKKPVSKTGFSSATKYSSVTFEDETYVLGAPEFVLKEKYEEHAEAITEHASTGARVLVFGTYDGEIIGKPLEKPVTPLAYVLLANPIREAAKETFQYFADPGSVVLVLFQERLEMLPAGFFKVIIDSGTSFAYLYLFVRYEIVAKKLVQSRIERTLGDPYFSVRQFFYERSDLVSVMVFLLKKKQDDHLNCTHFKIASISSHFLVTPYDVIKNILLVLLYQIYDKLQHFFECNCDNSMLTN